MAGLAAGDNWLHSGAGAAPAASAEGARPMELATRATTTATPASTAATRLDRPFAGTQAHRPISSLRTMPLPGTTTRPLLPLIADELGLPGAV